MKIKFSTFCWQCFQETDQSPESYKKLEKEQGNKDYEVDINEGNLYEFICPKGHKSFAQLQEEKFEILFDLGTMALLDGYSKESVSTIASSFERFIEFFIKVVCLEKQIEVDMYLRTWKTMVKQSERQIGAFYILQLIEFGDTKYILDEKKVAFRNKVIHQGYIPTSEEAIEYGEYIFSIITDLIKILPEKYPRGLEKAIILRVSENGKKLSEGVTMSSGSIPTILKLSSARNPNYGKQTFKEELESMKSSSFYKNFYSKKI